MGELREVKMFKVFSLLSVIKATDDVTECTESGDECLENTNLTICNDGKCVQCGDEDDCAGFTTAFCDDNHECNEKDCSSSDTCGTNPFLKVCVSKECVQCDNTADPDTCDEGYHCNDDNECEPDGANSLVGTFLMMVLSAMFLL